MDELFEQGRRVAALLVVRRQTLAVAESAAGGFISAALLAVPGASAYYLGGGVIYTPRARHRLLDLRREDVRGIKSASEPFAALLAERVRQRFSADWGIGETGAAGPAGNPYGDPAGHACIAIAGPVSAVRTLATGQTDRLANMVVFAREALILLEKALIGQGDAAIIPE